MGQEGVLSKAKGLYQVYLLYLRKLDTVISRNTIDVIFCCYITIIVDRHEKSGTLEVSQ